MEPTGRRPVEGLVGSEPMAPTVQTRRGCFFWGCLTLVLLGVIVGGCTGIAAYFLYKAAIDATSTTPVPVEVYTLKPGEAEDLTKRLAEFERAAGAGGPATLELSQDDLNAYVSSNDELKNWAGKAYLRVEGDQVFMDVSVPLDDVPFLSGRYFNGVLGVKLGLVGGRLIAFPETAIVNGKPVPDDLMKQFREQDILKTTRRRGGIADFNTKANSLEVRDGKIILRR